MLSIIKSLLLSASLVSCTGAEGSGSGSGAAGGGMNTWVMLLVMLGLMIVLFVVMSIPQRKREKKVKEMLDALKPGDRVRIDTKVLRSCGPMHTLHGELSVDGKKCAGGDFSFVIVSAAK